MQTARSSPVHPMSDAFDTTVADIHTRQINALSTQVFSHTAQLAQLQEQFNLLGSQLQRTQLHISTVDARVPSFCTVTAVIRVLVCKINEVVSKLRVSPTTGSFVAEAQQQWALDDLEAINMELAMGELMQDAKRPKANSQTQCSCEWNEVCSHCFPDCLV